MKWDKDDRLCCSLQYFAKAFKGSKTIKQAATEFGTSYATYRNWLKGTTIYCSIKYAKRAKLLSRYNIDDNITKHSHIRGAQR